MKKKKKKKEKEKEKEKEKRKKNPGDVKGSSRCVSAVRLVAGESRVSDGQVGVLAMDGPASGNGDIIAEVAGDANDRIGGDTDGTSRVSDIRVSDQVGENHGAL